MKPVSSFRFVTPLRLIFWGGILCLFDFKFSWLEGAREGFQIDFINDFVGTILITVGLFRIAPLVRPGRVRGGMYFLAGVAVVSSAAAALDHFIFPRPEALTWATGLLSLVELASMTLFAACMRVACLDLGLERAARSWLTTAVLFFVVYVLPLGAFHAIGLISMANRSNFRIDLGPLGLLLLPLFLVPLIHLFISTSRMRRDAAAPIEPSAAAVLQ